LALFTEFDQKTLEIFVLFSSCKRHVPAARMRAADGVLISLGFFGSKNAIQDAAEG